MGYHKMGFKVISRFKEFFRINFSILGLGFVLKFKEVSVGSVLDRKHEEYKMRVVREE